MKVLHVNTSSSNGGAAIAACRLVEAMNIAGIEATLLSKKGIAKKFVRVLGGHGLSNIEEFAIFKMMQYARKEHYSWSFMAQGYGLKDVKEVSDADIVYLHWVNNFLNFSDIEYLLKTKKRVVWFMHDMWPFTGGCHHAIGCKGYESDCCDCQQMVHFVKIASFQLSKKIKYWQNASNLVVAAPSKWLAGCVSHSAVFESHKIAVIPNVLNTSFFTPMDKTKARTLLGLGLDKKIILFGAAVGAKNIFKGMKYLYDALLKVDSSYDFLVMGRLGEDYPQELMSRTHNMGYVNDEYQKVLIYNASDVFVITSIAENYPNMIIEAMACGVPSVAFPIGGIVDQIEHQVNGYLAELKNASSVSEGIEWILEKSNYSQLSQNCISFARENCSYDVVLKNHKELLEI